MRIIGVDLAWGSRNPSGLCAVENGRAVDSTLLRTDSELLDWLWPQTRGPCVVAFDAPLVVTNPTGARDCERTITRCFGRFHAGCHPSNLARMPDPRAARLARQLGLDPDPTFPPGDRSVRRAVEVYPNAALVALFDLQCTLKYKARAGRSVPSRHVAFTALTRLLTQLADRDPPLDVRALPRWNELTTVATTSPVGAALDRAEDELDAIVCAYVALYLWAHGTARSRIVGSATDGYIVTPVTPQLAQWLDAAGARR